MADCGELAVTGRPELDVLFLLLTVPARGEHLATRHHEPDQAPDVLSGECGQGHVRPDHRLGAERAADILSQYPDLGRRQPEQRGDGQLHGLDAHVGVIQRQLVTLPGRRGGQRFDRVVVVGSEPERRVDPQISRREPVINPSAFEPPGDESAEDLLRFVGVSAALVDRGHRRRLGVGDPHQRRGVGSPLKAVGHDDRDRLAGIVNHVILHRENVSPGAGSPISDGTSGTLFTSGMLR